MAISPYTRILLFTAAAVLSVRELKNVFRLRDTEYVDWVVYAFIGGEAALTTAGLIRRIQPSGSVARYETRVGDNHHHVVCRSCGDACPERAIGFRQRPGAPEYPYVTAACNGCGACVSSCPVSAINVARAEATS
mgnify:CR=1 FL=1